MGGVVIGFILGASIVLVLSVVSRIVVGIITLLTKQKETH